MTKEKIIKIIFGILLIFITLYTLVSLSEPCRNYSMYWNTPSCSFYNLQGLIDTGIIVLMIIFSLVLGGLIIWLMV